MELKNYTEFRRKSAEEGRDKRVMIADLISNSKKRMKSKSSEISSSALASLSPTPVPSLFAVNNKRKNINTNHNSNIRTYRINKISSGTDDLRKNDRSNHVDDEFMPSSSFQSISQAHTKRNNDEEVEDGTTTAAITRTVVSPLLSSVASVFDENSLVVKTNNEKEVEDGTTTAANTRTVVSPSLSSGASDFEGNAPEAMVTIDSNTNLAKTAEDPSWVHLLGQLEPRPLEEMTNQHYMLQHREQQQHHEIHHQDDPLMTSFFQNNNDIVLCTKEDQQHQTKRGSIMMTNVSSFPSSLVPKFAFQSFVDSHGCCDEQHRVNKPSPVQSESKIIDSLQTSSWGGHMNANNIDVQSSPYIENKFYQQDDSFHDGVNNFRKTENHTKHINKNGVMTVNVDDKKHLYFFDIEGTGADIASNGNTIHTPRIGSSKVEVKSFVANTYFDASINVDNADDHDNQIDHVINNNNNFPFATTLLTSNTNANISINLRHHLSNNHPSSNSRITTASRGTKVEHKAIKFHEFQKENWTEKFKTLLQFREKHGHCFVPFFYQENPTLAQWSRRQRYQYKLKMDGKKSTLSNERVCALNDVGFVWDLHKAVWSQRLEELKDFQKEFGHCNVPSRYRTNNPLAVWVKRQRRQWRSKMNSQPHCMTDEKQQKLETIGFVWDMRKKKTKLN